MNFWSGYYSVSNSWPFKNCICYSDGQEEMTFCNQKSTSCSGAERKKYLEKYDKRLEILKQIIGKGMNGGYDGIAIPFPTFKYFHELLVFSFARMEYPTEGCNLRVRLEADKDLILICNSLEFSSSIYLKRGSMASSCSFKVLVFQVDRVSCGDEAWKPDACYFIRAKQTHNGGAYYYDPVLLPELVNLDI